MEREILRTATGLIVTAEVRFPPHISIERVDGGLVQVLPGELRTLVEALCSSAALVAESVAAAGLQDDGDAG